MMSAKAADAAIRAPLESSRGFLMSSFFSASAGGCVDVGCSAGLEVVTETGERQR